MKESDPREQKLPPPIDFIQALPLRVSIAAPNDVSSA
jgi:hypothetical protein